jgi:hypothetical protein
VCNAGNTDATSTNQPGFAGLNNTFTFLYVTFNPDKPGWVCLLASTTGFRPGLFTFNPDKPDFGCHFSPRQFVFCRSVRQPGLPGST